MGIELDDGCARGSSDAGTDTKAPKSESVELAELIEPTGGRGLEGRVNMDEDPRRGEAGGIAGENSATKSSSRSLLRLRRQGRRQRSSMLRSIGSRAHSSRGARVGTSSRAGTSRAATQGSTPWDAGLADGRSGRTWTTEDENTSTPQC